MYPKVYPANLCGIDQGQEGYAWPPALSLRAVAVAQMTRERAAGVKFHLLQRIKLVQRMQSYTWGEMLQNAAQLAGGRQLERITVRSWPQRLGGEAELGP
jgi:hypothetical protein